MDIDWKKIVEKLVRASEVPRLPFQRKLMLDFVFENINSRPACKSITKEEIKAEIERILNGTA